jgi:myosin heavy subunit
LVFGYLRFQSFVVNGFEQLCINYANGSFSKVYNDIFQAVMEGTRFEGIALEDITFDDNSDVLELIEHRGGSSVRVVNEESVRPKGSDGLCYKAKQGNRIGCLIADMIMGPLDFGIHHYTGKVVYCATGFLTKKSGYAR